MRVVLVHPAGSNWVLDKPDISVTANRMAPGGLLSIAAYLLQHRRSVAVHDCLGPGTPQGPTANAEQIVALAPDLVGFSTTTSAFLDAMAMAQQIKRALPHVKIICGGVHVSALGARLLEQFEVIDYLAFGEGELTMSELVDGRPPTTIDGLIWRDGDRVVTNPPRQLISDLDSLPFPAYDALADFPRGYYLPPFSYINTPGATMITSRGCVYQCSYCDRSVFKRGFRYNSADYVFDHIELLHQSYGVRHINIYDDLFTTNRKRIVALCEKLARKGLPIQFNCAVRVGHTDEALLEMLRDAGCLMVSLGIESGDTELLERHKAGVELEEVRETVERIQAKGLRVKGLFMMGLPGETEASIRKTSDFVLSLDLDDMNMAKFTPFPGAPCWPTIEQDGTLDEDWRLMNCLNFVFLPKDIPSKERLEQLYNEHVKRFYTSPKWRRRLRRRLWQHRKTLWHFLRHLPSFLSARRHFQPSRDKR